MSSQFCKVNLRPAEDESFLFPPQDSFLKGIRVFRYLAVFPYVLPTGGLPQEDLFIGLCCLGGFSDCNSEFLVLSASPYPSSLR